MGPTLEALLRLQSIEKQLAQVRRRLKTRRHAVLAQEKKIEKLREDWQAMHDRASERRRAADSHELDLKVNEEQVQKLRTALNSAKTNKEYASILTQINTRKADNAKCEEEVLKIMQEVDALQAEADRVKSRIEVEENRLEEVRQNNAEEIERLTKMAEELGNRRDAAAGEVPDSALAEFERVSDRYEGEAMAVIEVHGKKPPFDYVCGGCFMSLNAEHANILRTRDEVRTCDNCRRILYMEAENQEARK
jgi:hypothetical protein